MGGGRGGGGGREGGRGAGEGGRGGGSQVRFTRQLFFTNFRKRC
jgi:hypothetical protein